ncbi:MAG TPA: hypothetical protein VH165_28790 [Kofleriaceae bacterium]|jgi:hypothetical protein|nr:hypothetical protein [Kofleriaceae bacterium]
MSLPVMTIQGDVVAAHSYWTDDGSRIVTESTVRTPDGDVVVSQLGGSVDGIGMRSMPSPAILELGMTVAVAAHHDVDLEQTDHVVLDSVKVMAYPPAYVRTGPTKAGHYLYWESGCIFVTIDAAGTTAIPGDAEFPVIDASIATWNTDTHTPSCSFMQVMSQGRKSLEVGNDHVNLIKFRDPPGVWGRPASGNDPARMYSPAAAGITTAVYIDDSTSARDGAILDADIEINGVDFDISVDPAPADGRNAVLQNTLTHELGHLHGLEHPCLAPGDPPRKDNLGNAVPDCSSNLPPSITEATMYNYQDPGETKKETLSDDDIQAMCEIYPVASDPGTCAPVPASSASGGCCSASGPFDRPDVGLLLSGMTFAIVMRRRRPSRAP